MEREAEVNLLNGSPQLNKLSLSKKLSRLNFKELMNLNLLILEKMKPIILTKEDRDALQKIANTRTEEARRVQRANILLQAADGATQARIAEVVGMSRPSVILCLKKYGDAGWEYALSWSIPILWSRCNVSGFEIETQSSGGRLPTKSGRIDCGAGGRPPRLLCGLTVL